MYRDKMISDWNKVNLKSPEGQRLFLEAAEHFLRKPAMKTTRLRGKSQEFTTPSDFPQRGRRDCQILPGRRPGYRLGADF